MCGPREVPVSVQLGRRPLALLGCTVVGQMRTDCWVSNYRPACPPGVGQASLGAPFTLSSLIITGSSTEGESLQGGSIHYMTLNWMELSLK